MRKRPWKTIGVVAMCAGLPPDTLHAALAAAAGTLFEAAPFVLVAELAAVSRIRLLATFAALGGCGCSRGRTPGAWSLPATALCWLAFGPAVAIARAGLAAAVWGHPILAPRVESVRTPRERSCADAADGVPDALAELAELVPAALLGFIGAQLLGSAAGSLLAIGPAGWLLAFGAGCALGAVVPCSTAGVALASAVAVAAPPAAAGLLATAGIVRLGGSRKRSAKAGDARLPTALLALALALLAWRGPSGLVNPRLIPLAALGAAVAVARLPRGSPPSGPSAYLVIALMLGALAAGSPVPGLRLDASDPAQAYPGSRLVFTGVALRARDATLVERFAIACCRLDASPIGVRLDRRLPVPQGAWVSVSGNVARDKAGLVLRASAWRRVPPPTDPFVYR